MTNKRPRTQGGFPLVASVRPATRCASSLVFAAGAAISLALQRWELAFLLLLPSALLLRRTAASCTENKRAQYSCTMTGMYGEFLVFLGLAIPYPLPAFLALSAILLSDYARARVLLVLPTAVLPSSRFSQRSTRVGILLVSLFLAYGVRAGHALRGFSFFGTPEFFLPIPELGVYAVFLLAAAAGVATLLHNTKRIQQAAQSTVAVNAAR